MFTVNDNFLHHLPFTISKEKNSPFLLSVESKLDNIRKITDFLYLYIPKKDKKKKEKPPREDGMAEAFFMFESKQLFDKDETPDDTEESDSEDLVDSDDFWDSDEPDDSSDFDEVNDDFDDFEGY